MAALARVAPPIVGDTNGTTVPRFASMRGSLLDESSLTADGQYGQVSDRRFDFPSAADLDLAAVVES